MAYRAGLGFPGHERLPSITCDGCGVVLTIVSNPPPKWFLDGRAKPGWLLVRHEEREGRVRMRSDYCPTCKVSARQKAAVQP